MKDNFEGPEYQRYNLQKWNDVTFQLIIDQNSAKSGMEQITILISKLDKMQKALSPEFRTEEALYNKIMIAYIITRRDPITAVLYVEMTRKVKSARFAKMKGAGLASILKLKGKNIKENSLASSKKQLN
ncbi:hypothetical protein GcM3_090028, partial [Golovinomyces cichoracearum]